MIRPTEGHCRKVSEVRAIDLYVSSPPPPMAYLLLRFYARDKENQRKFILTNINMKL